MNKLQLCGAALIIGAAAMLPVSPVLADDMNSTTTAPSTVTTGTCVDKDEKPLMNGDQPYAGAEDCTKAGGTWKEKTEGTNTAPSTSTETAPAQ